MFDLPFLSIECNNTSLYIISLSFSSSFCCCLVLCLAPLATSSVTGICTFVTHHPRTMVDTHEWMFYAGWGRVYEAQWIYVDVDDALMVDIDDDALTRMYLGQLGYFCPWMDCRGIRGSGHSNCQGKKIVENLHAMYIVILYNPPRDSEVPL